MLKLVWLIPAAYFRKLFYGPKLVGHSNFTDIRRNLVGLTEPRLLIDFARWRQNHWSLESSLFCDCAAFGSATRNVSLCAEEIRLKFQPRLFRRL
jgi:hypothetical protein